MGERNDITRIGDIEEKERLVDRLVESLKVLLKDELHHAKQVHINCLNKVSYLSKKMTELNKASNQTTDQTTESFDSKRFLNWRIICDKQHKSIQKEHKTALELIIHAINILLGVFRVASEKQREWPRLKLAFQGICLLVP